MAAEGQNGSKMLDEMSEYRIFELLKKYHYTLTTAESATGGMIASTLINVPGISAFFTEGYVTYSNEAKVKMIHVKPETIERYGVVSAETAADMAVSAARTADCLRIFRIRKRFSTPETAATVSVCSASGRT